MSYPKKLAVCFLLGLLSAVILPRPWSLYVTCALVGTFLVWLELDE